MSLVGVVTAVTSAINGAVVSVVSVISSLLEHEDTITAMLTKRINQDNKLFKLFLFRKYWRSKTEKGYENYVQNFIHLFHSPVMRGNKLEKSHIHILGLKTLSR